MATIWARVGGAWGGSIWDWINPETEEVEAYPYASPQSGDYVYTNGKAVTHNASISVGSGTISNAANDDLGIVADGYVRIIINSSISVTANIVGGAAFTATIQRVNTQSTAHNISITGSITTVVAQARCYQEVGSQTLVGSFTINGNVNLCANSVGIWCSSCAPTITGNVNCESNSIVFRVGTYVTTVSIVGNVTLRDGAVFTNGYENGTITIPSTCTLTNGARYNNTTNTTTITRIALGNYSSDTNFTTQGVTLVEVSGNFEQSGNNTKFSTRRITTMSIYGTTTLRDTAYISDAINYLTLIGNLTYEDNPTPLGNLISLTVGDEFEIHCISSGSNDIIMISRYQLENTNQYPSENNVRQDTIYAFGEKTGTYLPDYPQEAVVLKDVTYDNGNKTGNMSPSAQVGCVTPEDVRKDVPLVGMGIVGSLVVPSVDDVREDVVFDNGSVGTLIVQGGGERLRIADFGYYTRSTSITYIVDLTASDKPAFADCEEIVLRSLFPTLDLDNIPDKFFDDLFVQFLRYRLLVEYYRGTSINSKFTPSEPTGEIVNYANTKCEYWLNTANLFLQLWGEKYPNSVKKDRILL